MLTLFRPAVPLVFLLVVSSFLTTGCAKKHPVPQGAKAPCSALAGYEFPWIQSAVVETDFICHSGYAFNFNERSNTALWAVEHLTRASLQDKHNTPFNNYRPDPDLLPTERSERADYENSSYALGQLAPAEDFPADEDQRSETFFLSNVIPLNPGSPRGLLTALEKRIRMWTQKQGELYVITGPIYAGGQTIRWLGDHRVAVPTHIFKIILSPSKKELAGFLIPNQSWDQNLDVSAFEVPVAEVERVTGFSFFPGITPEQAKPLKGKLKSDWDR